MKSDIFRKKSLERLSSPERLDELMQLAGSRMWITLASIAVLLVFALIWGIFGRIPNTVQGQGILVKSGGLYTVNSLGSGVLEKIVVKPGDVVKAGQVVARIRVPDMEQQLADARKQHRDLEEQHNQLKAAQTKEIELNEESLDRQKGNLEQLIASLSEQASYLETQLQNQQKLLDDGLITRQTLAATRQEYNQVKIRIDDTRNQLSQLAVQKVERANMTDQRIIGSQLQVNQAQRRVAELENLLQISSNVVSPFDGRVLEVMAFDQDLVQSGSPLMNLELTGDKLKALVYIPSHAGKEVRGDMTIQISPATVKKERFGVLLGKVETVSEYPSTTKAMNAVLKNDSIVQGLASQGAQFAIQAALIEDKGTVSGFAWSSSKGPPVSIHAGTPCTASVVTQQSPPITLVVPFLRKFFGIY